MTSTKTKSSTPTALTVLIDLPFLAREINDAHAQVQFHAKSMLLEAKRAGEALIAAKKHCQHGEFKAWVEARTAVAERTAQKYMKVARLSKTADLGAFAGGVDAFLDAHAEHRNPTPAPATPAFTKAEAEYALKLKAMADRGGTEAEREVAAKKLDSFAQGFGLTGAEAAAKATEMHPNSDLTDHQQMVEKLKAELARREAVLAEMRKRYAKASKDDLIAILADLKARGVWKDTA